MIRIGRSFYVIVAHSQACLSCNRSLALVSKTKYFQVVGRAFESNKASLSWRTLAYPLINVRFHEGHKKGSTWFIVVDAKDVGKKPFVGFTTADVIRLHRATIHRQ